MCDMVRGTDKDPKHEMVVPLRNDHVPAGDEPLYNRVNSSSPL